MWRTPDAEGTSANMNPSNLPLTRFAFGTQPLRIFTGSYAWRLSWLLASVALLTFPFPSDAADVPKQTPADPPPLTVSQIVEKMIAKTAERTEALQRYQGKRSYSLRYVGFPESLHAEMAVDMSYQAPSTKEFTIVSESGSKWIITHVLKRLLDSEREALDQQNRQSTSLNTQNYDFTLLPEDKDPGGCRYALSVEPKIPNKFLFRGRIWVDGTDFAVCRIDAEPAKNPSFWIKKTEIHHTYAKFGDFWLPTGNQSVSNMRLGGVATLTIKYQDYKIVQARALGQSTPTTASLAAPPPKPAN